MRMKVSFAAVLLFLVTAAAGYAAQEPPALNTEEMKKAMRDAIAEMGKNKEAMKEVTAEMVRELRKNRGAMKEVARELVRDKEAVKEMAREMMQDPELRRQLSEAQQIMREVVEEFRKEGGK